MLLNRDCCTFTTISYLNLIAFGHVKVLFNLLCVFVIYNDFVQCRFLVLLSRIDSYQISWNIFPASHDVRIVSDRRHGFSGSDLDDSQIVSFIKTCPDPVPFILFVSDITHPVPIIKH